MQIQSQNSFPVAVVAAAESCRAVLVVCCAVLCCAQHVSDVLRLAQLWLCGW